MREFLQTFGQKFSRHYQKFHFFIQIFKLYWKIGISYEIVSTCHQIWVLHSQFKISLVQQVPIDLNEFFKPKTWEEKILEFYFGEIISITEILKIPGGNFKGIFKKVSEKCRKNFKEFFFFFNQKNFKISINFFKTPVQIL